MESKSESKYDSDDDAKGSGGAKDGGGVALHALRAQEADDRSVAVLRRKVDRQRACGVREAYVGARAGLDEQLDGIVMPVHAGEVQRRMIMLC